MNEANESLRTKDDKHALLTETGNSACGEEEVSDVIPDKKKEWLVPLTVRFSRKANEVFQKMADDYGVSKAYIVRLAAAGGLDKYLGCLQYVDSRQARQINNNICALGRLMQEMTWQLRRIGINYNQEIKLQNIKRKQKAIVDTNKWDKSSLELLRLKNQERDIQNDNQLFKKDEIEKIIARYEAATEKVSEALWHIQE